jgi:hypothetical protein
MDVFCLRLEMVAGCSGIGNELSGFIKEGSLATRLLASQESLHHGISWLVT